MISTRFLMGFGYLLRAQDIVINLLLCFDWIMGLFWIFLEENARLNLELVNSFFFTTNSQQHFFFPGIAWSRSSNSFEVNWCILVASIFFLTYFVKTIDKLTLVGRKFGQFFISFDTIDIWNIYWEYSDANVVEFLHHYF